MTGSAKTPEEMKARISAMRHYVTVYATMRLQYAVDAGSHEEAMEKSTGPALEHLERLGCEVVAGAARDGVPDGTLCHRASAEEVVGFLVDEAGDPDHDRSQGYDGSGEPLDAAASQARR